MIPYGKQNINQADIDAVVNVLQSDFLTQGPVVSQFEAKLCDIAQAQHATAVSNATAALHLACLALGVSEGDKVWTSPNTFVASANCALYCGASVDFVDICPITYNMSTEALEEKLIQAKKDDTLPSVVIPVHFAGQSCDMQKIKQLADQFGFAIIEDASHAIGGKYCDNPIGCCQYSDICVFSFHPVKIITTGEGGAALTNNAKLHAKMQQLRTHGITRDTELMSEQSSGPWYYEQIALGCNYRITDLQCALGLSQLNRLEEYIKKRNDIAENYHQALSHLPLILPTVQGGAYSAFHLYVVQLDEAKTNVSRKDFYNHLRANGIGVNVHYIPVHTQPYYKQLGFKKGDFPVTERYYKNAVTLPLHQGLTKDDFDKIIAVLTNYLEVPIPVIS